MLQRREMRNGQHSPFIARSSWLGWGGVDFRDGDWGYGVAARQFGARRADASRLEEYERGGGRRQ